jgi:hypothetical protein
MEFDPLKKSKVKGLSFPYRSADLIDSISHIRFL